MSVVMLLQLRQQELVVQIQIDAATTATTTMTAILRHSSKFFRHHRHRRRYHYHHCRRLLHRQSLHALLSPIPLPVNVPPQTERDVES